MGVTKNEDITKQVKALLGDSVEYAYTTRYQYDDGDWQRHFGYVNEDGSLTPTDCSPIVIKMKDRKPVILWSSEWGGIVAFDDENDIPASG